MENHRVLFQKGSAVYFWKKEGVTNNSHFSWQGERWAGTRAVFGMSNSLLLLGPSAAPPRLEDEGTTPQHLLAPFHGRFGCGIAGERILLLCEMARKSRADLGCAAEEAGLRKIRKVEPDPQISLVIGIP